MSGKILLVEDEYSIAEPVIYNLKQEGFSVTHVDEGPVSYTHLTLPTICSV